MSVRTQRQLLTDEDVDALFARMDVSDDQTVSWDECLSFIVHKARSQIVSLCSILLPGCCAAAVVHWDIMQYC